MIDIVFCPGDEVGQGTGELKDPQGVTRSSFATDTIPKSPNEVTGHTRQVYTMFLPVISLL